MKNLNKCIGFVLSAIFILTFSMPVVAGDLLIFDDPNLIALESGGEIVGYYGMEDRTSSCVFFFSTVGVEDRASEFGQARPISIETHVLDGPIYEYARRNTHFDIPGKLFKGPRGWVLQTSSVQAGCNNMTGTFAYDPDDLRATKYVPTSHISALGIRVVGKKTSFYSRQGRRFSIAKSFLVGGDVVAILDVYEDFSSVRFVHPATGKVTTGWVHSSDLVNPFPPVSK